MKNLSYTSKIITFCYLIYTLVVIYFSTAHFTGTGPGVLSFIPFSDHPQFDKLLHFGMYFTHYLGSVYLIKNFFHALVISFSLSFIMEVVQYFLPYRSFEILDLIANLSGCLIAMIILKLIFKKIEKDQLLQKKP